MRQVRAQIETVDKDNVQIIKKILDSSISELHRENLDEDYIIFLRKEWEDTTNDSIKEILTYIENNEEIFRETENKLTQVIEKELTSNHEDITSLQTLINDGFENCKKDLDIEVRKINANFHNANENIETRLTEIINKEIEKTRTSIGLMIKKEIGRIHPSIQEKINSFYNSIVTQEFNSRDRRAENDLKEIVQAHNDTIQTSWKRMNLIRMKLIN